MKWDAGYNVNASNHNGIRMKRRQVIPMTGHAPTGYDFFVLLVQNNDRRNEGPPGWLHNFTPTRRIKTSSGATTGILMDTVRPVED